MIEHLDEQLLINQGQSITYETAYKANNLSGYPSYGDSPLPKSKGIGRSQDALFASTIRSWENNSSSSLYFFFNDNTPHFRYFLIHPEENNVFVIICA